MKTSELMSTPVHTCTIHDSLDAAARSMWDNDCGAVAVVDDDGSLVGMLTDRDVCMAAYTQGRSLPEIPVATAMARIVFTVGSDDPVDRAEQLMAERQIRRVPVVDGQNRPIGLISMNDLARGAMKDGQAKRAVKLVSTLAAVCSPRGHALRAA